MAGFICSPSIPRPHVGAAAKAAFTAHPMKGMWLCARKVPLAAPAVSLIIGATAMTWSFSTSFCALVKLVCGLKPSSSTPRNLILRPSRPPDLLKRVIPASKPRATPAEMARSPSPPTMIGAGLPAAPAPAPVATSEPEATHRPIDNARNRRIRPPHCPPGQDSGEVPRIGDAGGRSLVVLHELNQVAVEVLYVGHGDRPSLEAARRHDRLRARSHGLVVERLTIV